MRLVDYRRLDAHPSAIISPEASYYGDGVVTVGKGSRLDHGVVLTGCVTVGMKVHIAPYCLLYGKHGIELHDYVGLGAFSVLHSESDDYSGHSICSPLVDDQYRHPKAGTIVLKRFSNLGTRCTVLPGVWLGTGAVVGAHSLVKADCFAWGIYAGTPAKWVKDRSRTCEGLAYESEGIAIAA